MFYRVWSEDLDASRDECLLRLGMAAGLGEEDVLQCIEVKDRKMSFKHSLRAR